MKSKDEHVGDEVSEDLRRFVEKFYAAMASVPEKSLSTPEEIESYLQTLNARQMELHKEFQRLLNKYLGDSSSQVIEPFGMKLREKINLSFGHETTGTTATLSATLRWPPDTDKDPPDSDQDF